MVSKTYIQSHSATFRILLLIQLLLKDKRFAKVLDVKKLIDLRTKLTSHKLKLVRAKVVCPVTGRGRGIVRFIGVSRFVAKRLIVSCQLPGIKSSSW